jgi:hypothetical protein
VEVLVEFQHLRDRVEFLRIVVPAFDEELESSHYRRDFPPLGQGVRTEGFWEVCGLAVADLRLDEDHHDGIGGLNHGWMCAW